MDLDALRAVRCFLLDMDGTFYLGDRLIDGALEFIAAVQARGQQFLFLTNNSSKDASQYVDKLCRLGLPIAASQVLTSGTATAMYLQRRAPGARVFVVGTPPLEAELERHGFTLDAERPEVVVLGFDTGLTYARLWRLCDLVRAGLPYLATHPDFNCPTESGFMPDIGATIAFVEASAGRRPDVTIGKPNPLIAEAAAQRAGVPVRALCMVGDRLYTDVALGRAAGFPSVLVLSGETQAAEVDGSPHQPDFVFANLGELGRALAAADAATDGVSDETDSTF